MKVAINSVVEIDEEDVNLLVETVKDWNDVHGVIRDYLLYDYGCEEDSLEYDRLYDALREEIEGRLEK